LKDVIPNHVLSATDFPPPFDKFKDELAGRSMVVQKTQPLPIECVVRGYVSGSGWKDYRTTGKICGIPLPAGLRESDRLPEPIFTPATKPPPATTKTSLRTRCIADRQGTSEKVRAVSLEIYRRAAAYAEPRGVILADTKFEFGILYRRARDRAAADDLMWIDEALTPDSSRFWPAAQYSPGGLRRLSTTVCSRLLERMQWPKTRPAQNFPLRSSKPLVPSTGKPIASWPGEKWISKQGPHTVGSRSERAIVKDQLEGLVNQMVERGILFDEAVGEFEKRFISAFWTARTATSPALPRFSHSPQYLEPQDDEYKLVRTVTADIRADQSTNR